MVLCFLSTFDYPLLAFSRGDEQENNTNATMPFLAKEHVPIPTKDLLSWAFDDLSYDWDEPVRTPKSLLVPPKRNPSNHSP